MKYLLSCILLCAGLFSEKAFAATDLELADSLFNAGNFEESLIYYERSDFYALNDHVKFQSLNGKAECYRHLKKYDRARETIARIDRSKLNDTSLYSVQYKLALYSYLNGDFQEAESNLKEIQYYIPDSSLYKNFYPLYILTLNEQGKWQQASQMIKEWSESLMAINKSALDSISYYYNTERFPKLKDPAKAQKLSAILPGLGQMYAGEFFWDGFTSLSLQTAFLAYTAWSVYTGFYATALVIGYGFLQKFYLGGITHVEYIVKNNNYKRSKIYNDQLRLYILRLSETSGN